MISAHSDLLDALARLHSLEERPQTLAVEEGIRLELPSLLAAAKLREQGGDEVLVFEVDHYQEAVAARSLRLVGGRLVGPEASRGPTEDPGVAWSQAQLESAGPLQARIITERPAEAGEPLQALIGRFFRDMVTAFGDAVTCAATHLSDVEALVVEFRSDPEGNGRRCWIGSTADGSTGFGPIQGALALDLLREFATVARLNPPSAAAALVESGTKDLPPWADVFIAQLGFEIGDRPPLRIAAAWEHFVAETSEDLCSSVTEIGLVNYFERNDKPLEALAILEHVLEEEVGPACEEGWDMSTHMPGWLDLRDRLRAPICLARSLEDERRALQAHYRQREAVAAQRAGDRFSEAWSELSPDTRGHLQHALCRLGPLEEGLISGGSERASVRRDIAVLVRAALEEEWNRRVWEPYSAELCGESPASRSRLEFEEQVNLLVRNAGKGSYVTRQGGDIEALAAVVNCRAYRILRTARNNHLHPSDDRWAVSETELQEAITAALGADRKRNWLLQYFMALPKRAKPDGDGRPLIPAARGVCGGAMALGNSETATAGTSSEGTRCGDPTHQQAGRSSSG